MSYHQTVGDNLYTFIRVESEKVLATGHTAESTDQGRGVGIVTEIDLLTDEATTPEAEVEVERDLETRAEIISQVAEIVETVRGDPAAGTGLRDLEAEVGVEGLPVEMGTDLDQKMTGHQAMNKWSLIMKKMKIKTKLIANGR